jgi:hypothetical protein
MRTVWKFDLNPSQQNILLPVGAQILCVQTQHGIPQLWALVDPETPDREAHWIGVYGTGHDVPSDPGRYVGTFQLADGALVFHVFDEQPVIR